MNVRHTSLMVIHPCAKNCKQMSNHKKLWTGHETAQTDGLTDRHTDERTVKQTDGHTNRQTE